MAFGIPDPDVRHLRFDVEVRALRMDNKLSKSQTEAWALLYSTTRDFDPELDQARVVPLTFHKADVLRFGDPTGTGDLGLTHAQIDALDELPLPRSRDIRVTVRAEADADAGYWAEGANVGKPTQVSIRRESIHEPGLIAGDSAARRIRALWLRPDPVPPTTVADGLPLLFQRVSGEETPTIVERLAQQIDVASKGLTLVGHAGERVIFGCSRRIRHTLAPDSSSLTLAAKEDLTNHWIVAITLRLDRDWKWAGPAHSASRSCEMAMRIRGSASGRRVGDSGRRRRCRRCRILGVATRDWSSSTRWSRNRRRQFPGSLPMCSFPISVASQLLGGAAHAGRADACRCPAHVVAEPACDYASCAGAAHRGGRSRAIGVPAQRRVLGHRAAATVSLVGVRATTAGSQ